MISIPECTLCGKNVDKLFLAEVEGSKVEVCEACGKFGKVLEEIKPKVERVFVEKQSIPQLEGPEEEFKSNYGKIIIQARQKLELERKDFAKKINEKESIIRRVELQQMTPDEKLRKKIENFLEIKLTEVYEPKKLERGLPESTLTLGDIIEVE